MFNGNRLKHLRESRGYTQQELADALELSTGSAVSRYESGVREPDSTLLLKIANYFNVSIDYLLGNTDNPKPVKDTLNKDYLDYKLVRDIKDLNVEYIDLAKKMQQEKLNPKAMETIIDAIKEIKKK